jgi:hypothetical protein
MLAYTAGFKTRDQYDFNFATGGRTREAVIRPNKIDHLTGNIRIATA